MTHRLYRPSLQQASVLAVIAALALGYGLLLRYQVIEQATVGIACDGMGQTWTCASRRTAIALYTRQVFGLMAIGAALLNLIRPSLVLLAIALAAVGAGIVLYNTALAALALALLVLSLARPVRGSR